jgi:hypothetical protein
VQPFDSFAELLEEVSPLLRVVLAVGFVLFVVGITIGMPIALFSGCAVMTGTLGAHHLKHAHWYDPFPPHKRQWLWGRLIRGLVWLAIALLLVFLAMETR